MSWDPVAGARSRSGAEPSPLAYPAGSERFQVRELPLYEPCGEGEHLYLEIEKRDIDTPELIARVAAALNVSPREIGWAGLKDRAALACQRLSVPRQAGEKGLGRLGDAQYRVLEARPHRNKLRIGHLAGNRFRLILAGQADPVELEARLAGLCREGLPNYFGPQRFGARQDNHLEGLALLRLGRGQQGQRARFLLSAYQSGLFNRVVAARLEALDRLLLGDLAWIHGKGAVFRVMDPEAEQPRAQAFEISPSGPLPGRRMSLPEAAAGELEQRCLAEAGWEERFAGALTGGRRPLRVPVGELVSRPLEGGIELEFSLPPGSYASVLLAELGIRLP